MSSDVLFRPFKLKGLNLPNRVVMAPMTRSFSPGGIPTEDVAQYSGLKYIEAGERAAIDYIPKIKDRVFSSEDMKEGIQSFVERRSAVFRGK